MKNKYPGFYSPSEAEVSSVWQSEKTIFVFDTSTLLNLYGYASQTRDDFFSILKAVNDRIWLPYHVGLEYQRRRLTVVSDEKKVFKKIESLLGDVDKIFKDNFSALSLNRRFPSLHSKTEKLHKDIKRLIESYEKSVTDLDNKQPCVRTHDVIREQLNDVFDGKVGDVPVSQQYLNDLFKEGELRYKNGVPPGYKDSVKDKSAENKFFYAGLEYDRQYGDLIIWKQIIEKAKEENIDSVVVVTDDAKEDWWYIINSRGEKNVGPRAELREEICREAKVKLFTMYNTSGFLDDGKKLLKVAVKKESIDEANNLFYDQARNRSLYDSVPSVDTVKKSLDKLNLDEIFKYRNAYDMINNEDRLAGLSGDEALRIKRIRELVEADDLNKKLYENEWMKKVQQIVEYIELMRKFNNEKRFDEDDNDNNSQVDLFS